MTRGKSKRPAVAVVMGSDSDWPVLQPAVEACHEMGVACEVRVLSAHRTPQDMARWARGAERRGLRVIIAGAGGAAHLPGMVASHTVVPVIGVPVQSRALAGIDSLLSIVQMPSGVPVATVAIGAGRNAGLLAVSILAAADPALRRKLNALRVRMAAAVRGSSRKVAREAARQGSASSR